MASASTVQTRAWCFTLNNPVRDEPVPATEDPKQWGASYLVYQLEKGESGTPHYQGYLYFPWGSPRTVGSQLSAVLRPERTSSLGGELTIRPATTVERTTIASMDLGNKENLPPLENATT